MPFPEALSLRTRESAAASTGPLTVALGLNRSLASTLRSLPCRVIEVAEDAVFQTAGRDGVTQGQFGRINAGVPSAKIRLRQTNRLLRPDRQYCGFRRPVLSLRVAGCDERFCPSPHRKEAPQLLWLAERLSRSVIATVPTFGNRVTICRERHRVAASTFSVPGLDVRRGTRDAERQIGVLFVRDQRSTCGQQTEASFLGRTTRPNNPASTSTASYGNSNRTRFGVPPFGGLHGAMAASAAAELMAGVIPVMWNQFASRNAAPNRNRGRAAGIVLPSRS